MTTVADSPVKGSLPVNISCTMMPSEYTSERASSAPAVIGAIGTAMHRRLNGTATFSDLRSAAYAGGLDLRHRGAVFQVSLTIAITIEASRQATSKARL